MESKKAGGVEVGRIVVEGSITSTNLSHQYDFLRRERKPTTCRVRSHGHIRALVINLRFAAAQRRTIVCGFSHRFSALQLAKRRSCDAGLQSSTFAPSHLRTFAPSHLWGLWQNSPWGRAQGYLLQLLRSQSQGFAHIHHSPTTSSPFIEITARRASGARVAER